MNLNVFTGTGWYDNGSSYIPHDLARWIEDKAMDHVRGAPDHLQTQGKIKRWHQTLKNCNAYGSEE